MRCGVAALELSELQWTLTYNSDGSCGFLIDIKLISQTERTSYRAPATLVGARCQRDATVAHPRDQQASAVAGARVEINGEGRIVEELRCMKREWAT